MMLPSGNLVSVVRTPFHILISVVTVLIGPRTRVYSVLKLSSCTLSAFCSKSLKAYAFEREHIIAK